jgi:hypothetical protein
MMNNMKLLIKIIAITFAVICYTLSLGANQEFEIVIQDHLFFPSMLELPAGQKIRLLIINQDPTAEEFESYELNREKVIPGNSRTVIFVGPLSPGEYLFFGEFYPRTAQGMIIVK